MDGWPKSCCPKSPKKHGTAVAVEAANGLAAGGSGGGGEGNGGGGGGGPLWPDSAATGVALACTPACTSACTPACTQHAPRHAFRWRLRQLPSARWWRRGRRWRQFRQWLRFANNFLPPPAAAQQPAPELTDDEKDRKIARLKRLFDAGSITIGQCDSGVDKYTLTNGRAHQRLK